MIGRFPTFPLTVSRNQAASVKAGVQTTTTRGEQSVNGRTDAMHAPNAVSNRSRGYLFSSIFKFSLVPGLNGDIQINENLLFCDTVLI